MSTLKLPDGTLAEDVHEWRRVHRQHLRSQPGFSRLRANDQRIALHVVSVQSYAMGDGALLADEGQVAKALKLSRRTVIRALRVPDPKQGRAPGAILAQGVLGADPPRWDTRSKRRLPNVYRLPGVTVVCPSGLSQETATKSRLYVESPTTNGNGHVEDASASVVVASALATPFDGTSGSEPHQGGEPSRVHPVASSLDAGSLAQSLGVPPRRSLPRPDGNGSEYAQEWHARRERIASVYREPVAN